MFDSPILLENNTIILRPLQANDFAGFAKLTSPPKLWTYFTQDLSDPVELKDWIQNAIEQLNQKIRMPFTIISRQQNTILGSSSFGNISYHDLRLEIGWTWLSPKYQGKGFNDQAKYLMLKYAFETLEFERIEFKTDVLNLPARNALKRIGAIEEGVLRSHTLMTHQRRRDTIFYSILKSEWPEVKQKIASE